MQGKKVDSTQLDVHKLLKPLFQKVHDDMGICNAVVHSKVLLSTLYWSKFIKHFSIQPNGLPCLLKIATTLLDANTGSHPGQPLGSVPISSFAKQQMSAFVMHI